jgi:hypothetical protein
VLGTVLALAIKESELGVLNLKEDGDSGGLNGHTTLLLIGTGIHVTGVTSSGLGDNTTMSDEGIRESGLSVIDVSNDGDVADVVGVTHQLADFFNTEVNLEEEE